MYEWSGTDPFWSRVHWKTLSLRPVSFRIDETGEPGVKGSGRRGTVVGADGDFFCLLCTNVHDSPSFQISERTTIVYFIISTPQLDGLLPDLPGSYFCIE